MNNALVGNELRSTITSAGELELRLTKVMLEPPSPNEVIVRIEASPINPSDLGLLIGPADISTLTAHGTAEETVLRAVVAGADLKNIRARLDQSLPVGNEGAGTVISAGANATHLMGKKVAMLGGGMYTQFRKLPASDCVILPDGAEAADGAAMFVNPLTALGFTETMKAEGHKAIVHTAAASNLGQMLNRICLSDGISLVNVVRGERQVALLKDAGARHIVDSASNDFDALLAEAIGETGATLGFDAIGGGKMAGRILTAMETAANKDAGVYSRYGSTTFKQVYIYGSLDMGPIILERSFGWRWAVGGWLLMPFLQSMGDAVTARLRERIARELRTTFASRYTASISLTQALQPDILRAYNQKSTGEKYLIVPNQPPID